MRLSLMPRFSRFLLTFFFAYALVLTIFCPFSYSGDVTLAWDASSDATVVGYKIYRGTSTGIYDYEKDVGDVTTAVITGLDPDKDYYFSATGYNSYGDESNFCNEVKVSVPSLDTDKDGISDADELSVYGTNPNNPDTDGDGLSDGDELAIWQTSWNADIDNDGIINLLDRDADGDGLTDGYEISTDGDPSIYDPAPPVNQPPPAVDDQQQDSNTLRVSEGLVALYDFREGSGTTVRDVSGFGMPLNLSISNISAVGWLAGGGLSLDAPVTIASSGAATKIIAALQATNAFTVEAWVRPANTTQNGPARIVTCSANPNVTQNFMLGTGHWGTSPTDVVDARLLGKNLTTQAGSLTTGLTHLVFTRESSGAVKVYIDGVLQHNSTVSGDFSTWNKSFPLVLGNEPTGDRPWAGELYLVAIYDRSLPTNDIVLNYSAGPAAGSDNQLPDPVDSGDNQNPVNSTPVANDDIYNTAADTKLIVSAAEGVFANDYDADGDTMIAVLVGGSGPSSGSLVLNANGSLTYMPYTGFSGSDNFSYYAEDPLGNKEIATVTINIEPPIASAPVSTNDTETHTFNYATGTDPAGWLDTGAKNSMMEDDSLFKTYDVGGQIAFGTTSTLSDIHSHFVDADYNATVGFVFTGRMRMNNSRSGIGVTFLSDYPNSDSYYRLRRYSRQRLSPGPAPSRYGKVVW